MKKKLLLLFTTAFAFGECFAQQHGAGITTKPSFVEETYTLPIVFHVINNGSKGFNLDAAMLIINDANTKFSLKDNSFIKLKTQGKIPDYFLKDVPEDTKIRFCLAHTDTAGNATSGITYNYTGPGPTHFTNIYNIFDPTKGGVKPWDKNKYINIYILDQLPERDLAGSAVEKQGIAIAKFSHSISTSAHELAHYLGLAHSWGGER